MGLRFVKYKSFFLITDYTATLYHCASMTTQSISAIMCFIVLLIFRRDLPAHSVYTPPLWTYPPHFTSNILQISSRERERQMFPTLLSHLVGDPAINYRSSLSFPRLHIPQASFPPHLALKGTAQFNSTHLWGRKANGASWVPGSAHLVCVISTILTPAQWDRCYCYPHLANEEMGPKGVM